MLCHVCYTLSCHVRSGHVMSFQLLPPPSFVTLLCPPSDPNGRHADDRTNKADGRRPLAARGRPQARDGQKQEGVRRSRHQEACPGRGGTGHLGDSGGDGGRDSQEPSLGSSTARGVCVCARASLCVFVSLFFHVTSLCVCVCACCACF